MSHRRSLSRIGRDDRIFKSLCHFKSTLINTCPFSVLLIYIYGQVSGRKLKVRDKSLSVQSHIRRLICVSRLHRTQFTLCRTGQKNFLKRTGYRRVTKDHKVLVSVWCVRIWRYRVPRWTGDRLGVPSKGLRVTGPQGK